MPLAMVVADHQVSVVPVSTTVVPVAVAITAAAAVTIAAVRVVRHGPILA